MYFQIIINKDVFPIDSAISDSTKIFVKEIKPRKGDIVLDIGTGTGIFSIIAVKRGAKKVISIDIDDNAINNANENKKLNKLDKIIEVRKSNLFENIDNNEKYDLILANIPLTNYNYKGKLHHLLFDFGFKLHERLLKEAKNHLTTKGKLLIPSGDVADEKKLLELIKKYGYNIKNIKKEEFNNLIWKVYILDLKS